MKDLGKRIDLHTHSLLSDGALLPSEIVRYASDKHFAAIAVTDHVDYSNLESVIKKLLRFSEKQGPLLDLEFIPGVEITHVDPRLIGEIAAEAKRLGAKLVVCHGETPSEPVARGTNHAAVMAKGLVDILAHPGMITEEDVRLAKENGVYLELSAKTAHNENNSNIASLASWIGAKLLVNTDAHDSESLITQEEAYALALEAGLAEEEALKAIKDNPRELLDRIKSSSI